MRSCTHIKNKCGPPLSLSTQPKPYRRHATIWVAEIDSLPTLNDDILKEDDDDEETETFLLRDPHTNRELDVGIDGSVVIDKVDYYIVHPVRDPISIVSYSSNTEIEAVENADLTPSLLSSARDALSKQKMELIDSAYVLTVDDDQVVDEDILSSDDEDNDVFNDDPEYDDPEYNEEESVEVLADFDYQGRAFAVVRSESTPTVLVARRNETNGDFEAVTGSELTKLTPKVEEEMLKWPTS